MAVSGASNKDLHNFIRTDNSGKYISYQGWNEVK